jgi:hypothetical protein
MTRRERMVAEFRLEQPDHFPLHVRGVRAWDEQWCESRHASYQPIIEAVREHGAYEVGVGIDRGHVLTGRPIEATSESEDIGNWIITRMTIQTSNGRLTAARKNSTRGLPGLQVEYFVKTLDDLDAILAIPWEPVRPDSSWRC